MVVVDAGTGSAASFDDEHAARMSVSASATAQAARFRMVMPI